jgi:hypothetical protein
MTDETWHSSLPEPLRDAPYIAKADSPEQALEHIAHAAQIVGNSTRIPKEGDPQEKWDKFFDQVKDVPGIARLPMDNDDSDGLAQILAKLGAPSEPDGYGDMPEIENFEWDDDVINDLKLFAQQAGLTQMQFQTLARGLGNKALQDSSLFDNRVAEMRAELKNEWGAAYEDRTGLIRGWLEKSDAPDDMKAMFEDGTMSADAMKWLHGVAELFKSEVKTVGKDGLDYNADPTPLEAEEKIQDILDDPAYWDASDPRQKLLMQKMQTLVKLANPDAAA